MMAPGERGGVTPGQHQGTGPHPVYAAPPLEPRSLSPQPVSEFCSSTAWSQVEVRGSQMEARVWSSKQLLWTTPLHISLPPLGMRCYLHPTEAKEVKGPVVVRSGGCAGGRESSRGGGGSVGTPQPEEEVPLSPAFGLTGGLGTRALLRCEFKDLEE